MQTKQEMYLDFLGAPETQLIIPVYQRVYAWTERQCRQLWGDIMRAGARGSAHFIGTVLYVPESDGAGTGRLLDVIDGQQRSATLTLLLAALRAYLAEADATLDGITPDALATRYLYASTGASGNARAPKLLLSRVDQPTMAAIIDGTPLPAEDDLSQNVVENYRYFRTSMQAGFTLDDARQLWGGLRNLLVITALLEGDDRPQLIFESLNSKGMPLTTADLVRNLMLANVGYEEQTRLYGQYWAPIERLFANDPGSKRLNAALHGYLAITAPSLHIGSADEVYGAFKAYLQDMRTGSLEELLIGLKGFCETFAAKSQSTSAAHASAHANWANGKVEGIISEKKLFGD